MTNSGNGGKLKDSEKYEIVITDEAIKKVPKLNVFDNDEINTAVQMYSKQILSDMKNHEAGTEKGIAMPLNLKHRIKSRTGEEGAHSVQGFALDEPYVFIHNHPSGNTFSHLDVDTFIGDPNLKALYAVGNNGSFYALLKTEKYDWAIFCNHFTKHAEEDNMEEFLKGVDKYGLLYIAKRC